MNSTNNSTGAIIHQVEVNVYYKDYVERMRMDVCNLEKTNVILGILWLQAHNPEINWEMGKVEMTRCLPLYRRNMKLKEEKKVKRVKRVTTIEKEKIVKWTVDNKKNWRREKEIKVNYRKIEEIVPQKFLKQRKVFRKVELEKIPMRKIWNYAIDLKEMFKPKKGRIYPLSKNKRKKSSEFHGRPTKEGIYQTI